MPQDRPGGFTLTTNQDAIMLRLPLRWFRWLLFLLLVRGQGEFPMFWFGDQMCEVGRTERLTPIKKPK